MTLSIFNVVGDKKTWPPVGLEPRWNPYCLLSYLFLLADQNLPDITIRSCGLWVDPHITTNSKRVAPLCDSGLLELT